MNRLVATFRLLSFWRVGTGQGDLGSFDSRCARDGLGLPVIPGRSVRGLFREAVREAALFTRCEPDIEGKLFGARSGGTLTLAAEPSPGTLRFDDARLPDANRAVLAAEPLLVAGLFVAKRSTAMEMTSGTARPHSLRFDEVALPVTLEADIQLLPGAPDRAHEALAEAAKLIRGVGSQRTRGLGRAIVTVSAGGAA